MINVTPAQTPTSSSTTSTTAPPDDDTPQALPVTGNDPRPLTGSATALLAAGAVLVAAGAHRQRSRYQGKHLGS